MSIWNKIDRAEFEARVRELHRVAPTQAPETASTTWEPHRPVNAMPDSVVSMFPQDVEKQLCDDFAFLAAWEGSPDCVAGATVAQHNADYGLKVVLAANGGVAPCVTKAFHDILQVLNVCAQQSGSRQMYSSQCLKSMLSLHRNRILGRLGSKAFSRDKRWAPRKQVPTAERLQLMIDHGKSADSQPQQPALATLLQQISVLRHAINRAEAEASMDVDALEPIIEAAAAMTAGSVPLREKLKQAGYPDDFMERKEMRQIKALGNYRRCSNYFTWAARKYRSLFRNTTVVALEPYSPEYWPTRKDKHFVHAEIQLLIHHDMNPDVHSPRHFGVSKKACYLCFCFIRAHKTYPVPETHGEVYPQWTIPQRDDYTAKVWRRLNSALIVTGKNVHRALNDAQKTKTRYGPRAQSVVNSLVGSLRSPSTSTLRAPSVLRNPISLDEGVKGVDFASVEHVQRRVEQDRQSIRKTSGSIGRGEQASKTQQGNQDGRAYDAMGASAPAFTIGWLDLFVDPNVECTLAVPLDGHNDSAFNSSAHDHTPKVRSTAATCTLLNITTINVEDPIVYSGFIIQQQSNANGIEVKFVNCDEQSINVHFSLLSE